MSDRCENCDQPKATPEDWRSRALAAEAEVLLLQAEVRRQVYVSRVLYDREVVERAQLASDEPAYWPEGKTGRTA